MWAKRPVVSPKCVLFCEKSSNRSNDMPAWARAQNDITMTAIRGMVSPVKNLIIMLTIVLTWITWLD
jgi:hypothetical protein